jgi:hypothetical protein
MHSLKIHSLKSVAGVSWPMRMSHSILRHTIVHLNIAKCAPDVLYFLSTLTMNLTQLSIADIDGIRFKIDLDSEQCLLNTEWASLTSCHF